MKKILAVYGTRPEAIKMAPLIKELARSAYLAPIVAVTGQHREMLDQVNALFAIRPAYDLNIIAERQRLEDVTARVLAGVSDIIGVEEPSAVVVQGDTTTCFAAGLSAFYRKVPVIHLEAGLRTGDPYNPYPEEINRRLTAQLARLHLAPTPSSKSNLEADGIDHRNVFVTGNTVIDALLDIIARDLPFSDVQLAERVRGKRVILVTAHRRESWGEPLLRIAKALVRIARTFPDVVLLFPAHLNPVVRETVLPPLSGQANIIVTPPLSYSDFARAMNQSTLILTDSGGIQEEAPSLGKPVLVMRETTERPEAVLAGTVKLVGTSEDLIFQEVSDLLNDRDHYKATARPLNPYGDGKGAIRCKQAIEHFFGFSGPPAEFCAPISQNSLAPRAASIVNDLAA